MRTSNHDVSWGWFRLLVLYFYLLILSSVCPACNGNLCFEHDECDPGVCIDGTCSYDGSPPKLTTAERRVVRDGWHVTRRDRLEVRHPESYILENAGGGGISLLANDAVIPILVSDNDYDGVKRVACDLKQDIERVAGFDVIDCEETPGSPFVLSDMSSTAVSTAVIIGTLGKNPLIAKLIRDKKLKGKLIEDKWESFVATIVKHPTEGIEEALVIAGSDQRGTIYGVYDLCSQIGISPWHYFADVPPKRRSAIYINPQQYTLGEPAVKYRGIFINNEYPALTNWAERLDSEFYGHVFELMLRLKANYIWPAVWGRAFALEDDKNLDTARKYGIVVGTSHEAAMMRSAEEWDSNPTEFGGDGVWDYLTNRDSLVSYWIDGIDRMVEKDYDGVVTLGMRDTSCSGCKKPLDEKEMSDIFTTQRSILGGVVGGSIDDIPQVWTLFKEVQDYWEKGVRPPSDVTVVWCDDSFGNLRMLRGSEKDPRRGGYGLYVHFDYVGSPRNYKWVDTNLLPNIWEQLHLAYKKGVDRLWVANVGDLKSLELPMQFFLDYAWNPDRWTGIGEAGKSSLKTWEEQFAAQQFGTDDNIHKHIAGVLRKYADLQSDRKPEMLNRTVGNLAECPFSLTHFREMEKVVEQWRELSREAKEIEAKLDDRYKDAYFELVLYRVQATTNLYELRLAGFNNKRYAEQGRAIAADMKDKAYLLFEKSKDLARHYNVNVKDGKWRGFQTQAYMGYGDSTESPSWQQPQRKNGTAIADFIYPPLVDISETPLKSDVRNPVMGIALDGDEAVYSSQKVNLPSLLPAVNRHKNRPQQSVEALRFYGENITPALPVFSPYQVQPKQYIEVFKFLGGSSSFDYEITTEPEVDWLDITNNKGTINEENLQIRAELEVNDWEAIEAGRTDIRFIVRNTTDNTYVTVPAIIDKPMLIPDEGAFVQSNGYVSIEADQYHRIRPMEPDEDSVLWKSIPGIGRTGSGMSLFPVTTSRIKLSEDSPLLEYDVYLFDTADLSIDVYLSPRQNVLSKDDGLLFGLSVDDQKIETIDINQLDINVSGKSEPPGWRRGAMNNVHRISVECDSAESDVLSFNGPGLHTIKIWGMDPTVIVQKLVIRKDDVPESYLGPPQSMKAEPMILFEEEFDHWDSERLKMIQPDVDCIADDNGKSVRLNNDDDHCLQIRASDCSDSDNRQNVEFKLDMQKEVNTCNGTHVIEYYIYVPDEESYSSIQQFQVAYSLIDTSENESWTEYFSEWDKNSGFDEWTHIRREINAESETGINAIGIHFVIIGLSPGSGDDILFYLDDIKLSCIDTSK